MGTWEPRLNRQLLTKLVIAFAIGMAGTAAIGLFTGITVNQVQPLPLHSEAQWVLRSRHILYGLPELTDARYEIDIDRNGIPEPGISVLVREGFVVGHCAMMKAPLWVSMQWASDDLARSSEIPSVDRRFRPDDELPDYARAETDYQYSTSHMDRGHLARHRDNAAWGEDNSDAGCLMSNICPQQDSLNRGPWLALEDMHRSIVGDVSAGIERLWVISGTIYDQRHATPRIGNGVGVPEGLFKIIAWFDSNDMMNVRAYVYPQTASQGEPSDFLTSVDEVEDATGIDFFPRLHDDNERALESQIFQSIW
jgi:endonuclease G